MSRLATPLIGKEHGVFTFYGESTIKASAKDVHAALRDFRSYSRWNPYIPQIKTASGTNDIAVGDMITLQYRPEPQGSLMAVPCKITSTKEQDMSISWQGCPPCVPAWICLMEKVHKVTPVSPEECLFQVWETQAGPMAYIVKWTMGQKLSAMSQGVADCLKEYVEAGV